MAAPMTEYVYDPTRRFHGIYDYNIGLVLMIVGSITTIIMTIVTLVMIFGDHNYIAGSITGMVLFGAIFIASPMFHCSDKRVKEKREVYNQYLSMSRADRNKYKGYIRTIHGDQHRQDSLDYADLIKIFRSKSLSNPNSIEATQVRIKQELKALKAMEKLNASAKTEIDDINKSFDL